MNEFTVALHGDSEAACVDILKLYAPLTTGFPAVTIATSLRGYTKDKQWVFIARKGGNSNPWMAVDKPRIDFNIYAATRADAHDIAQLVLTGMLSAQTNYVGKGVRLQYVRVETGISRAPDLDNDSDRYVLSLRLTVTPE
jgi:hypothetical protein